MHGLIPSFITLPPSLSIFFYSSTNHLNTHAHMRTQEERGRRQQEYEVSCLSAHPLVPPKKATGQGEEDEMEQEQEEEVCIICARASVMSQAAATCCCR